MTEQRFTFDAIAAEYDARRPDYPAQLFDDLARETPAGGRVLEVGCGTGKATEGLVGAGLAVTALDPGVNMLAQAWARLAEVRNIRLVQSTFESWTPKGGSFDLICAAQAWHWVDPAVGYIKAASLLADGGRLAIFGNVWGPAPPAIAARIQAAFDAAFGHRPPEASRDAYAPDGWIAKAFAASDRFEPPSMLRYERPVRQTGDSFAGVVATYSDTRMLPEPARTAFLAALRATIDEAGGAFEATLETYCHVGRVRRSTSAA